MIDATDALLLPRAQLTADEKAAADQMETQIKAHVHRLMQRRGRDEFHTKETNRNVIAEVNLRLIRKNWRPTWHMKMGVGALSNDRYLQGFQLVLEPSVEAYRDADAKMWADSAQ